jgi:hypothetical protein
MSSVRYPGATQQGLCSNRRIVCCAVLFCSIFKFLRNPRKPVILAMSRPDAKKNITTLVKAYGKNKALRDIANLVLIMGNREVSGCWQGLVARTHDSSGCCWPDVHLQHCSAGFCRNMTSSVELHQHKKDHPCSIQHSCSLCSRVMYCGKQLG